MIFHPIEILLLYRLFKQIHLLRMLTDIMISISIITLRREPKFICIIFILSYFSLQLIVILSHNISTLFLSLQMSTILYWINFTKSRVKIILYTLIKIICTTLYQRVVFSLFLNQWSTLILVTNGSPSIQLRKLFTIFIFFFLLAF